MSKIRIFVFSCFVFVVLSLGKGVSAQEIVNCGWCGLGCVDTRLKMACAMIAPPSGKSCANIGGKCTITTTTGDTPCSSDASCSANEYCYQPPMPSCPPGVMCKLMVPSRVCRPKKIVGEGQMCGGIAGIMCATGLKCEYGLMPEKLPSSTDSFARIYPDQSGVCVRATTGLNCGWCGTGCVDTRLKMACAMIVPPEGKSCQNVGEKCTIVTNPQKPCGSDNDCGPNAYCYQPPMPSCPPGAMCKLMMPSRVCRNCIPRPSCLDGVKDSTGKMIYCDTKPGMVYCPKPTTPCGFCGANCIRLDPRMDCASGGPVSGMKCVDVGGKCAVQKPTAGLGEFCGGISGIMCEANLRCDYGVGRYESGTSTDPQAKIIADKGGICVKDILKCEWCGTGCRATSPVAGACPEIAPPGDKVCVPENGACVIKPRTPTCIPRPPCMDGIKDANGNVVYCDSKPGIVYCPNNKKGDANGDGKVDLADFALWKKEYIAKLIAKADFNKDGKVDLVDFSIWKDGYLNLSITN